MTQEAEAKNAKDRCKCGQSMNLGALRSKIRCYLEVLTRLQVSVWRKRPDLCPYMWILRHDNAHDMLRVHEFLTKKILYKMDHLSYSPDLAPCDCLLFQKLKKALKRLRFADIPDIKCNVTLLQGIPENDFQDCFQHHHLTQCIASQGEYSEGKRSRCT
jgi:hypothetical protein